MSGPPSFPLQPLLPQLVPPGAANPNPGLQLPHAPPLFASAPPRGVFPQNPSSAAQHPSGAEEAHEAPAEEVPEGVVRRQLNFWSPEEKEAFLAVYRVPQSFLWSTNEHYITRLMNI